MPHKRVGGDPVTDYSNRRFVAETVMENPVRMTQFRKDGNPKSTPYVWINPLGIARILCLGG